METARGIKDIEDDRNDVIVKINSIPDIREFIRICTAGSFAIEVIEAIIKVKDSTISTLCFNNVERAAEFRKKLPNNFIINGPNGIITCGNVDTLYGFLYELSELDKELVELLHSQNHLQIQTANQSDVTEPTDDHSCQRADLV
jgi:hypothetical protein